nr:hypothetical protein [Tanacetum cinerariifolium]
ATVKAKTINGEVQLQALVDGKKVIIIESTKRKDLQLEYDEGVDCVPNDVIFKQLTLIGTELVMESSKEAEAEVTEGSSKRTVEVLEQKNAKKQKIDDDKETDVETLWKLVKAKHGSIRPEEGYEKVLWVDLKVISDPYVEDEV